MLIKIPMPSVVKTTFVKYPDNHAAHLQRFLSIFSHFHSFLFVLSVLTISINSIFHFVMDFAKAFPLFSHTEMYILESNYIKYISLHYLQN